MDYKRLPDGELEVMQALWDCSIPATRKEIEKVLFSSHPMAVTTLLTFLTRLSEKGYVHMEKGGRTSLYSPCITRQEYLAAQSNRFVKLLCGGSIPALASALCDSGLSKEELTELRQLLEEHKL